MPVQRAAYKALRQNRKAHARNLKVKNQLKKLAVQLRKAATAKKIDVVKTVSAAYLKALDRAAQKRVIHQNTAARKKARIIAFSRKAGA
jgi:small subunit ribosomal protein S20